MAKGIASARMAGKLVSNGIAGMQAARLSKDSVPIEIPSRSAESQRDGEFSIRH